MTIDFAATPVMPTWPPGPGAPAPFVPQAAAIPALDHVTILRCPTGQFATKHVVIRDGELKVTRPNDHIRTWDWTEAAINNIHDLARLLGEVGRDPRLCIIRGQALPGIPQEGVRRLLHQDAETGDAPTFSAQARYWGGFDNDKMKLSRQADLANDPEDGIRLLIREHYPRPFWDVSCYWTLSSSAAPFSDEIYVRLYFLFDRAISDAEMKAQIDAHGIPESTRACFNGVQLHYVSPPIFEGCVDWLPRRAGLLVGERDVVSLPPTPFIDERAPERDDGPRPEETPELVAQAIAHLATLPPHRAGNNMMWHAALTLTRGFALSEETTFQLLRDHYDSRCEPPWDDEEKLRHKAEDAFRTTKVPLGYLALCSCRACDSVTGGVRPVTLDMLRKYAKQLSKSKSALKSELGDLLEKVVAGEPFGEGDARRRDDAVARLTFDLTRHFRGYSGQSIAKLFEPSLKKMKERDPNCPGPEVVLESLRRAQKKQQVVGKLICGEHGKPENLIANVMLVLSTHPDWRDVLAYCEFSQAVIKLRSPPTRDTDGAGDVGEWTDEDTTRTCAWFAAVANFEPNPQKVEQAVAALARKRVVHPVREYLDALTWDGGRRIDTFLHVYFRTDDTPYTRSIGRMWLISACARAYKPGCKVDTMVVLESPQGRKKSSGLRELVPNPEWFSDTPVELDSKDRFQCLRKKWIYEIGELDSFRGKDSTRIKSFMSSPVDNYRASYGRGNKDYPRSCVMAGTTNDDAYLIDRTGNRRFWPAKCHGTADVEGIRRDRDQIWAEAVARYKAGEKWWIDSEELQRLAEDEQAQRETGDDWTNIIGAWLQHAGRRNLKYDSQEWTKKENADPEKMNPTIPLDLMIEGVSTADVLFGAIEMAPDRMRQSDRIRAGAALKELGLVPRQTVFLGVRERRYYWPANVAPPRHQIRWARLTHAEQDAALALVRGMHQATGGHGRSVPMTHLAACTPWPAEPSRINQALTLAMQIGTPSSVEGICA